jgi:hypothetical protein
MMWMLVTVLCMSSGLDARCERHIRPPVHDRAECLALVKPTLVYLSETAEATGGRLIFLSARCEPGVDG